MSDTSDTSADTFDKVNTYCDDEESMLQSQQEQQFHLEDQLLRRTAHRVRYVGRSLLLGLN